MSAKKKNTQYKYNFSFVMPVYNVDEYLAETIESILAQTMDFEQNCELILVDDESPDKSEEVCRRYKELYPDNIKYIKQKHAGVCAARNRGLDEAEGKYVSLLDSDDKLSPDTLEEVYRFFEKNKEKIDVVAIKLQFFDARTGEHPLNYKFQSSRIIDIHKEFDAVQLSAATAFIKQEVLEKNRFRFDPGVGKYAEDAKFITEVILEKEAYGVVDKPTYYYRKRTDGASSLDGTVGDKFWYMETPKRVFYGMFDDAVDKFGYIPKYIQFLVMYDLQWRFKQRSQRVLSKKELSLYKKLLAGLLEKIEDEVILKQRSIHSEHKIFVLGKKHNENVLKKANRKGQRYYYNDCLIYDFAKTKESVFIELINVVNGNLIIDGYASGFLFKNMKLEFKVGKELYSVKHIDRPLKYTRFIDEKIYDKNCFRVELPLEENTAIIPYVIGDNFKKRIKLTPLFQSRFSTIDSHSYRLFGEWIVTASGNHLFVQPRTVRNLLVRESRRLRELVGGGRLYGVGVRLVYYLMKPFIKNKIWLISDRINVAGDNGEALFRYVDKHPVSGVKVYFAVSKKSKDFRRLKQYRNVINRDSFLYKLLFLHADKVISSHADTITINAFDEKFDDFNDLLRFDFVFLQHGIIQNDLSGWLNKYNKDIRLFVTSAAPEYKSIQNDGYGYDKNVVKLTGLPRYDLLNNSPKGKIIIAPTWRKNLIGDSFGKDGCWSYSEVFKRSDYYKFYQGLMDDNRVQSVLRDYDMTLEFYIHPSISHQASDFVGNERCRVMSIPYDYKKAFSQGSLLVTDYSSVSFDFAYLKKPVVYTQFDKEDFFSKHLNPGYFSYENDGFGKVTYDHQSSVDEMIKIIRNDCKVEKKYLTRIEKFFYKFDKNNSKRVYEAILAIDDKK